VFWSSGRYNGLRNRIYNAYRYHMFGTVCSDVPLLDTMFSMMRSDVNVSLGAQKACMREAELFHYISQHFRPDGTIQSACCDEQIVCQHSRRAGIPHEFLEQRVLANFMYQMRVSTTDRFLAITQGGHLGLVSKECQVGDGLCLMLGSTVPLVLRSVWGGDIDGEKCAQFFGDSYVHGVMNGEAMETFKSQVALHGLESASQDLTLYCLV